ncbi:hypothetical protein RQP46_003307 [Phenoliferia psychrophenolica]
MDDGGAAPTLSSLSLLFSLILKQGSPTPLPMSDHEKGSHNFQEDAPANDNNFGRQISFQDADEEPELTFTTWIVVTAAVVNYLAGVIFLSAAGFWAAVITAEVGGAELNIWIQQAWKIGRRNIWIFCTFLGMLGSIVMATAQSAPQAVAATAIYGIGFANSGNVFAVPAEVLPRRHRGTAAMAVSLGGYSGSFIGILAGASLITTNPGGYSGWRTMFWITMAAHAVSLVLIIFAYHPPPPPNPEGQTVMARILDFDLVGTTLLAIALTPMLVGLFAGGVSSPWSSPKVIGPLVVGCVFTLIFAAHQKFFKKDGLLHSEMFRNRNAALCLFAIAVEGFVYNIFTSFYGAETGALYEPRPVFLGLRFAIFGVCAIAATPIYMYAAYKYKLLIEQLSLGFVLFLIGIIGLATLKATENDGKIVLIYVAICGIGFASPISCLLSVAQLSMAPEFAGLISGLMISFRSIGGAIGTAICSAVFVSKLTKALPSYIASAALEAGLPPTSVVAFVTAMAGGDAKAAAKVPGVTAEILGASGQAIKNAYAYSYRYIWIVVAPFVLVSLICCLGMKSIKKEMNFLVDRPVEEIHHKHNHVGAPPASTFNRQNVEA